MEDNTNEKKKITFDKATTPWDGSKKNNPSPMDRYTKKMSQLRKTPKTGK